MATLTPEHYRKQTLFVESILAAHPEFTPDNLSAFPDSDQADFVTVFLPNWDMLGVSYIEYLKQLTEQRPDLVERSQRLLRDFCDHTGTESAGLFPE